ncbi:MAG TPA: metalloprotease PmbA [Kangiella sp.]|uniref:metalloprotease PmbA n=1 Tax=Kangiella sp. TaxID=1920245 RepID=UPI002F935335
MAADNHLTLKQIAEQQASTEQQLRLMVQVALQQAADAGADQSEIWCYNTIGNSIEVRQGELETLEFNQDSHFGINVYFGQRKGTVSINDLTETAVHKGVQAACEIAAFTEPDPFAGLVDKALMAAEFKDLQLDHPNDLTIPQMVESAKDCEAVALKDARIKQSEGVSSYNHRSVSLYANSHGFIGANHTTRFSLSTSVIAETDNGMIRDGYYTIGRDVADLLSPDNVGELAAERVINKLKQGKIPSGNYPVIFNAELARGLWSHMLSALKGAALYQRASFLLDKKDQLILPEFVQIEEDPFLLKGFGSGNYDSDGVATRRRDIVVDGVLKDYFLSGYSARRLGLKTTGNAGGIHNILIKPMDISLQDMMKQLGSGLLLTEVMGQGVNTVTGNYSRGASGFWFENGEIQFFAQELTIAGNLETMLKNIVAISNDVDDRSSILTGSVAIEGMMVAS